MSKKIFSEQLPDGCPHQNAKEVERVGFWRFIFNHQWERNGVFDNEAFSSQYGRGKACPIDKDICDWASCSMFDGKRAATLKKVPPFKGKVAAEFTIPKQAGLNRLDGDHLHLWRYDGFDLSPHLTKLEKP